MTRWFFILCAFPLLLGFLGACSRGSPQEVLDYYRRFVDANLSAGTPAHFVEEFFTSNNVPFAFESSSELQQSKALDVETNQTRFAVAGFKGRYEALFRDVGRSGLSTYSIRVYVYLDADNRVTGTDLDFVCSGL